jgi:hypothetical protein
MAASCPKNAAPSIVACDAPVVGSQRAVTRDIPGIMSLSTSSLFALKAFGLTVPSGLLVAADEVIE